MRCRVLCVHLQPLWVSLTLLPETIISFIWSVSGVTCWRVVLGQLIIPDLLVAHRALLTLGPWSLVMLASSLLPVRYFWSWVFWLDRPSHISMAGTWGSSDLLFRTGIYGSTHWIIVEETDLDGLRLRLVLGRHLLMHHNDIVGKGDLLSLGAWSLTRYKTVSFRVWFHKAVRLTIVTSSRQDPTFVICVRLCASRRFFVLLTLRLSSLISLDKLRLLSGSVMIKFWALATLWCVSTATILTAICWSSHSFRIEIDIFLLNSSAVLLLLSLIGSRFRRLTMKDVAESINARLSLKIFVHLLFTLLTIKI